MPVTSVSTDTWIVLDTIKTNMNHVKLYLSMLTPLGRQNIYVPISAVHVEAFGLRTVHLSIQSWCLRRVDRHHANSKVLTRANLICKSGYIHKHS